LTHVAILFHGQVPVMPKAVTADHELRARRLPAVSQRHVTERGRDGC